VGDKHVLDLSEISL
jgi:hypothetical protein